MSGAGITIATLAAILTLDATDFSKGASKATDDVKGLGDKIAGFAPIAATGFAVAGAAIVGVGAALYSVGSDFDAAFDKIRVGTGKTGEALDGLKGSFETVVSTVPASFEDASTAITMLNQRLGLTGAPLEMLSEDFLDLSRITGEDLTTSIQSMTRVFGDWNIKDQVSAMDEMFRASQATGAGMSKLAEQVVQFGAPLRGLGFGFEESLAMLGKWEKEGVNVENVMGAMKKAYGQFSKEFGAKAPEEFRKFVEQLSKAPTASAAAAMAIEKLGVRNGPDFAAAVKEGRFAYGDLVDQIKNGTDSIGQAGADTEDFAEKWQRFTNRMKVAVEPLATAVFGALGNALDSLSPIAETATNWLGERLPDAVGALQMKWDELAPTLAEGANRIKDTFGPVADKIREAFEWLINNQPALIGAATAVGVVLAAGFVALGTAAWGAAAGVIAATWPVLAIAAAVGAVVAVLVAAYNNWDTFRDVVNSVVTWLIANVPPIFEQIKNTIIDFYNVALAPLISYIQANSEAFINIGKVLLAVAGIIVGVLVVAFAAGIAAVLGFVVAAAAVIAAIGALIAVVYNLVQVFWDLAQNVASAIADAVRSAWNLWQGVQNMSNAVQAKLGELIGFFFRLGGQILDAVGNLQNLLWSSGAALIEGLWNGISSKVGWIKSQISGVLGSIRNLFPFSPAKEGPFSGRGWTRYSGEALAEDFAKGITMAAPKVMDATKGMMALVQQQIDLAGAAREALDAMNAGIGFKDEGPGDFTGESQAFSSGGWGAKLGDLFFAQHPNQDTGTPEQVRAFLESLAGSAASSTFRGAAALQDTLNDVRTWNSAGTLTAVEIARMRDYESQLMNSLARYGGAPPQSQITFNGDTDSAFATAFQKLVRTGQIQVTAA